MLIYFAFSFIALMGFCGLALDVARMEARSLQLQTAADNAAISYALEYGRRGNVAPSAFTAMATSELAAYAAANNLPTPTLTVQSGASSGPYAGNTAVVEVRVQQTMPTMMLGLLSSGSKSIQFSRTAVAAMPPCATFYTTLNVTSHSRLLLNCPIAVGTSLSVDGSSHIAGSHTLVAGPASSSAIAGAVSPAPVYNWPSETHPDSYATFPGTGGCQANNLNLNNTTATLSPGFYCNSSTINNSTVTLLPGYYTMEGGLTVTRSTIGGGPVTMTLEKNSSDAGQFLFSTSVWTASAPTTPDASGNYGIFLACVVPVGASNTWGSNDVQISSSTITADGIISCGLVGATISNSILRDAGHFFSVVFSTGDLSATTFTTSNDYTQLPGGSPHAYTVNILQ